MLKQYVSREMNRLKSSLNLQDAELEQLIIIFTASQQMHCYLNEGLYKIYSISTARNGVGEKQGSECTPRGWHQIYAIIGEDQPVNTVFVERQWTGEIYDDALAKQLPERDWILTRILQLDGLEPGYNRGGDVDTLSRYIYIHGTPDKTELGKIGSRGCIRMRNQDVIELAEWVKVGSLVYIC